MKRQGLFILLVLLGWTSASAQVSTTAEVSGTVVDEVGAAIEGAQITLQNLQTGTMFTDQTNDQGWYIIRLLPPGRYELVVEKPGFTKFIQTGLNLRIGQKATINIKLKVAPIEQEIEVRAEPPLVEPAKTEVSQIIEGIRIADLPINGRRFVDFALLTPGVTIGRALSSGSSSPLPENVIRISIAGLSEQYSTFLLWMGLITPLVYLVSNTPCLHRKRCKSSGSSIILTQRNMGVPWAVL